MKHVNSEARCEFSYIAFSLSKRLGIGKILSSGTWKNPERSPTTILEKHENKGSLFFSLVNELWRDGKMRVHNCRSRLPYSLPPQLSNFLSTSSTLTISLFLHFERFPINRSSKRIVRVTTVLILQVRRDWDARSFVSTGATCMVIGRVVMVMSEYVIFGRIWISGRGKMSSLECNDIWLVLCD